ncbi:MAG: EAL domain-containing protein [Luteimonas sp.]
MNTTPSPDRPQTASERDETAATLQALERACEDPALPAPLRDLICRARDALRNADVLAESAQQRYRALFDAVPDPVSVLDANGIVLDLNIQGLKLSQLFVAGVPGNPSDVAVCRAVSAIASSLGLGLVAEGVESEVQRQFLLQLGVPVGQGFLFAPGLTADDVARCLKLDMDTHAHA